MKKKPIRKIDVWAFLTILLIVGSLGGIFWARWQWVDDLAPRLLQKDAQNKLYLIAGQSLLLLDIKGKILQNIPLKSLGLSNLIMDLEVLNDGSVLIGNNGNIFRCYLTQQHCSPLLEKEGKKSYLFPGAFRFTVNEIARKIYVTNALMHRLEEFTLEGQFIRQTHGLDDKASKFCYPNDIQLLTDGNLAIADTDNYRIVFVDTQEKFGTIINTIATSKSQFTNIRCLPYPATITSARSNRWFPEETGAFKDEGVFSPPLHGRAPFIWPIEIMLDQQERWWVINAGESLQWGDVLIFDQMGNSLQRVALRDDKNAIPSSLLALDDRVLIIDNRNISINTVNYEGVLLEDFGTPELHAFFEETTWQKISRVLWYSLFHSLLHLGILLAIIIFIIEMFNRYKKYRRSKKLPL